MDRKLQIHNSTAEFLIFEKGIEVLYQDEAPWLTQDAIATLFNKGRSTIAEHLKNIFQSQELQKDSACRKFRRTAADGKDYLRNTALFKISCFNLILTVGTQIIYLISIMKKNKSQNYGCT